MKEYSSVVTIDAPAEKVWDILTSAEGYRDWNPEIVGIDGHIAEGNRITAHVRLGSGVVRNVALKVTKLDPSMEMEWVGGIPLGFFTGTRRFTVTPTATGSRFRLHLEMKGLMLRPILKSVGDRQPEVDAFSNALKARAERR
jgi:uncharacterized protein YndB with AHSA1/START domain